MDDKGTFNRSEYSHLVERVFDLFLGEFLQSNLCGGRVTFFNA